MSKQNRPANTLTMYAIAGMCDVTISTVYRWISENQLPASLFRHGHAWLVPKEDGLEFVEQYRARREPPGHDDQPFPPGMRVVPLSWFADVLDVSMGHVYKLNTEGKLPASIRRIDGRYWAPLRDAEQFAWAWYRKLTEKQARVRDRDSVGLTWLADQAGVTRGVLNRLIDTHPLPATMFLRAASIRLPRQDAEAWLRTVLP